MSTRDFPPVDLREYATEIRKVFAIEEFETIDFKDFEEIPSEIERRRAVLKYFIPDVFRLGSRYDRRADLIDACIFYLEYPKYQGGRRINLLKHWTERAGFSKRFRMRDVEEDAYGYMAYHPINFTIVNLDHPGDFLPRLVRYIRSFKGRKHKLDNNDYFLIFAGVYHSYVPRVVITPKMNQFLRILQQEVEKPIQDDAIDIPGLMQQQGFKSVADFYAQYNAMGPQIFPVYEQGVFGLNKYVIRCPFPHHFKVKYLKEKLIFQHFLVGGEQYIQQIFLDIPVNMSYKSLYRRFAQDTQIWRWTFIPSLHQSFLRYFDPLQEDWTVSWGAVVEEWKIWLQHRDEFDYPFKVEYEDLDPSFNLLKICQLLMLNGNISNKTISDKTKIPPEEVKKIRYKLDKHAFVCRHIFINHANLLEWLLIEIDGQEQWKHLILKKVGEIFPYHYLLRLENMVNGEVCLGGFYHHPPSLGVALLKYFTQTFDEALQGAYCFHKLVARPLIAEYDLAESYFDPHSESWIWDADDFDIQPINLQSKSRSI